MKAEFFLLVGFLACMTSSQNACTFKTNTTIACDSTTTLPVFQKFFTKNNGTLIKYLNLTDCNIPTLPSELFRNANLTNLVEINIYNCRLTKIEDKAFIGLPRMKKLVIRNNDIKQLSPNQFDSMRILEELILDNNNIMDIPAFTFNGLNGLVNLSLVENKIRVLRKDFLQTSGYIERVNLRNSGVEKIEPFAFGFISNLREIDLGGNDIPHLKANNFMGLSEMETLNLSSISIRTIDPKTFTSMDKLRHLDLTNNQIQNISVDTFYGLGNLRTLNLLGNNYINHIMNNSFYGLNELEELYLPKYCYQNISTGFFSGLTQLKELDLSNMGIHQVNPDIFHGLLNLEKLNISNNRIQHLKYNTFYKLRRLNTLDLSSNSLTNFGLELAVCTYNNFLKNVKLSGNPWNCQRLFNILNHLDQLDITYDKSYNEFPYIRCQGVNFKRAPKQMLEKPPKNIKMICETIPIEIETEYPVTQDPTVISITNSDVESTTPVSIQAQIENHINERGFEMDYLTLVVVVGIAVGFGMLMIQIILRSKRNKANSPGYHIYHFTGPSAESQVQLSCNGISNPMVHEGGKTIASKIDVA